MTLLDLLTKAAGAAVDLVTVLDKAAAAAPDLAPEVEKIKAALAETIAPANLVALAEALPGEILSIAQGKLEPTKHAGDAT